MTSLGSDGLQGQGKATAPPRRTANGSGYLAVRLASVALALITGTAAACCAPEPGCVPSVLLDDDTIDPAACARLIA